MALGMSGVTVIRDESKSSAGILGTHCVRWACAMIPSKARTHERHSGLLLLAAEVPREVQAASYFLRKRRYLNIFLNLPTKGILSQERSVI